MQLEITCQTLILGHADENVDKYNILFLEIKQYTHLVVNVEITYLMLLA